MLPKDLAAALRAERERRGLARAEVASVVAVSDRWLAKLERGAGAGDDRGAHRGIAPRRRPGRPAKGPPRLAAMPARTPSLIRAARADRRHPAPDAGVRSAVRCDGHRHGRQPSHAPPFPRSAGAPRSTSGGHTAACLPSPASPSAGNRQPGRRRQADLGRGVTAPTGVLVRKLSPAATEVMAPCEHEALGGPAAAELLQRRRSPWAGKTTCTSCREAPVMGRLMTAACPRKNNPPDSDSNWTEINAKSVSRGAAAR